MKINIFLGTALVGSLLSVELAAGAMLRLLLGTKAPPADILMLRVTAQRNIFEVEAQTAMHCASIKPVVNQAGCFIGRLTLKGQQSALNGPPEEEIKSTPTSLTQGDEEEGEASGSDAQAVDLWQNINRGPQLVFTVNHEAVDDDFCRYIVTIYVDAIAEAAYSRLILSCPANISPHAPAIQCTAQQDFEPHGGLHAEVTLLKSIIPQLLRSALLESTNSSTFI